MPVFVGVDPGISATGFGVILAEGSRLRSLAHDVISTPRGRPTPERLLHIYRTFLDVLRRHRPVALALEDIFYARNVRSAFKLAQVRGVIQLAAADQGIPVTEFTPMEVKKAVVGYGRAGKAQVQRMVQTMLGLDEPPAPSDVSDALALAICHANTSATLDKVGVGGLAVRKGRRR